MLFVHIDNFLDFVIAAHEDATAIVDMLWHDGHHPPHLAVNCLTASCVTLSTIESTGSR